MDKTNNSSEKPEKEEVYLSWNSPSRLFKKRDREYFTNIGAIVFLLTIILVFAREFLLIAAVLSIVFLIYVLSTVPPEEVLHKITSLGIDSAGHFYKWEELSDFWFKEQWGQNLLILRPYFGPHIIVLLDSQSKDKVRGILTKHIPFLEKPPESWVDNAATWLTEKIPLEKPA